MTVTAAVQELDLLSVGSPRYTFGCVSWGLRSSSNKKREGERQVYRNQGRAAVLTGAGGQSAEKYGRYHPGGIESHPTGGQIPAPQYHNKPSVATVLFLE